MKRMNKKKVLALALAAVVAAAFLSCSSDNGVLHVAVVSESGLKEKRFFIIADQVVYLHELRCFFIRNFR
ncbi:MAG: hypothetical protein K2H09_02410 [Treponemataceae bacterium]|nr:hypothetical protein [Treponemataceae bacterium]